ncbi:MAG TPA: serine/threonine-protein kinase, partial [Polyangiaceae bacterium]|nr:serine/threonine-protein kinase [Polyangiaceae bacterium]
MATVYIGRLTGSGGFARTVAIKQLHPQFAKDPEFVSMFLDEARLAARIRHPNVVPTLDVVASRGEVFLVMEYVQGESLSRLARALSRRGERVPLPVLLRVMADVLQGLHAAHEARDERGAPLNVVHRDVTPQNILVGIDGVARLLDFGVAKASGRVQTTREGQIKGKLAYMAPEQLMGFGVTRETDIYASAVVLWEMLTGERLFGGGSEVDVMARVLGRQIQPPSSVVPQLPKALDDLVMRGLAGTVGDRFASAREMCVALSQCALGEAPAVAVGEWVEKLAAEALAERSAKIAAIETSTDVRVPARDSVRLALASRPPPSKIEGRTVRPPTEEHSNTTEAASDPVGMTLTTGVIRRRARLRMWGATTAAGALVLAAVLAFALSGRRASERTSAVVPPLPTAAAAQIASTALVPPSLGAAPDPATAEPAPSVPTPLGGVTSARRVDSPPARRAQGAPAPRPAGASTTSRSRPMAEDTVFG